MPKGASEKTIDSHIDFFKHTVLRELIGKDLQVVRSSKYVRDVSVMDTTFESENESWPGLIFYFKNKKVFFVETNWQDKQIINRVVVVGSDFTGPDGIRVGDAFKDIKLKLSKEIPSFPDGYFGLRTLGDSGVTCFFDVEADSNEGLGNITFDTIDENLKVIEILME